MSEYTVPDEMKEIVDDFITESQEGLSDLERIFVDLEKEPGNLDLINTVFRTIHSMKGAADFLGFTRLVKVTHKGESLLNQLRKGTMSLTPEIMDLVFETVDLIKVLLEEIIQGGEEGVAIDPVVNRLAVLLGEATEEETTASSSGEDSKEEQDEKKGKNKKKSGAKQTSKKTAAGKTKPKTGRKKKVAPPVESAPAKVSAPSSEPGPVVAPEPSPPAGPAMGAVPQTVREEQVDLSPAAGTIPASAQEQTIRVDVERLDAVMNLVGELVLARNRLFKINHSLEARYGEDEQVQGLIDSSLHLSLLTTDLQQAVLKTRMQPMRKVFNKIPRMVRDLARKKMKEIDLEIVGEETEVDKSIIEEIGDPLVHLIRNAVDHGIEIPEFRGPLGKPEKGHIRVAAFYEGDHIIIEIEDDGKGMDPNQLREKAVEKGILDPADAERLSDRECLNLIFTPGFSTAERVTSTSGRGVGMDVVKANISKLGGIVNIESRYGEMTRVRIRLPLTVAIIQALMVGVEEEVYAIPLSSVIETLRVSPQEIQTIDEKEVICLRDEVLPLIHLSRELGTSVSEPAPDQSLYVVVTGLAEKKIGIVVSTLFGQEEIVIKTLGNYLKGHREFSGATLTGDGKVIMILDISVLMGQQAMV